MSTENIELPGNLYSGYKRIVETHIGSSINLEQRRKLLISSQSLIYSVLDFEGIMVSLFLPSLEFRYLLHLLTVPSLHPNSDLSGYFEKAKHQHYTKPRMCVKKCAETSGIHFDVLVTGSQYSWVSCSPGQIAGKKTGAWKIT